MRFRLNPYIDVDYLLRAYAMQPDGSKKVVRYNIEPNAVYDTDDFKDTPNIVALVQETIQLIDYKPSVIADLDKLGSRYSLKKCTSCGGRITRIRLYIFQEV